MPTATVDVVAELLRAARDRQHAAVGPARSPAKKFSPTSCTPASSIAVTNASTSASAGTGGPANGHQNSTASKPAALAAAGRSSSGSSVKRIEQFAR